MPGGVTRVKIAPKGMGLNISSPCRKGTSRPKASTSLWTLAVPAEFESYHAWDFTKFGRGERFAYKAIPQSEFDDTMAQVKRWELDQFLKERDFATLTAQTA